MMMLYPLLFMILVALYHGSGFQILKIHIFFDETLLKLVNIAKKSIQVVTYIQWLPLEILQVLFNEAKLPFSEKCVAI